MGGERRCFPRGLQNPDPAPEQAAGLRAGQGLEVGLEMQELPPEPQQPHFGVIFLPVGIPKGCLAAPAEVSSSCATDEGCAAGSAA